MKTIIPKVKSPTLQRAPDIPDRGIASSYYYGQIPQIRHILQRPRPQNKLLNQSDQSLEPAERMPDQVLRKPKPEEDSSFLAHLASSSIIQRDVTNNGAGDLNNSNHELRIADVEYTFDNNSNCIAVPEKKLSDSDKKKLMSFIQKLKEDDPAYYSLIEKENILVTIGDLPPTVLGKNCIESSITTRPRTELQWLYFDKAGGNFQESIEPSQEAIDKAIIYISDNYDDDQINSMSKNQQIRTRVDFTSIIILDLEEISATFENPVATLKHEAGHFIFESNAGFNERGERIASNKLPPYMVNQLNEQGMGSIETEVDLLSELAAEGAEATHGTKSKFELNEFLEEFDLKFGVSGYRDINGNILNPQGFGLQVKHNLKLREAKSQYKNLQFKGFNNIFLKTVVSIPKETRLFNLIIEEYPERKLAKDSKKTIEEKLGFRTSVIKF